MKKVMDHAHGSHDFEILTRNDRFTECLMMGLRLTEGVPVARLEKEGGKDFAELIAPEKIKALQGEGLLEFDGITIKATQAGLQRLNGVLSYLL